MKKIIVLLVSVFAINTFNAFATNNKTTVETQTESDFYTCHFSLDHYSGTTTPVSGHTSYITVRLNCPQEKDVYATVYVYIDGECVTSQLFKIAAGKTESDSSQIQTGHYSKEYTLKVQ